MSRVWFVLMKLFTYQKRMIVAFTVSGWYSLFRIWDLITSKEVEKFEYVIWNLDDNIWGK